MNELALFAGAGGGILGGHLLGWRTVCAVERDAYAAQVLAQRQNDGILRPFPIWSDVTTFDGKPWRGIVDVVSGGFPCQDISAAGKGAGITGARSGLWKEMARIIGDIRPSFVFVENSPMLTTRGLGTVLGDLASMGFDAEWGVLSAADVGACHIRERCWILAANNEHKRNGWREQFQEGEPKKDDAYLKSPRFASCDVKAQWRGRTLEVKFGGGSLRIDGRGEIEPTICGELHGLSFGVDRIKALGNSQYPSVAATAFNILRARLDQ